MADLDKGAEAWRARHLSEGGRTGGAVILWDGGFAKVFVSSAILRRQWRWEFHDIALSHDCSSARDYQTREEAENALIAYGDEYYDVANAAEANTDAASSSQATRATRVRLDAESQVRLDIESFVVLWEIVGYDVHLDSDDRRVADALAVMAAELVKADDPPKSVLRAAFEWFARRLDMAADEAAKIVGKGAGAAALAGGVAATGQLPKLIELAQRILQHLG